MEKLKKRIRDMKYRNRIVLYANNYSKDIDLELKEKPFNLSNYEVYKDLTNAIDYRALRAVNGYLLSDLYSYFISDGQEKYVIDNYFDYLIYNLIYSNYYMQALRSIVKERSLLALLLAQYISVNIIGVIRNIENKFSSEKNDAIESEKNEKGKQGELFEGFSEYEVEKIKEQVVKKFKSLHQGEIEKTLNELMQMIYYKIDNDVNRRWSFSLYQHEIEKVNKKVYEYLNNYLKKIDKKIYNKIKTITGKIVSSINVGEVIPCNSNKLYGFDVSLADDTGTLFAYKYINEDFMNKEKKGTKEVDVYIDCSGSMTDSLWLGSKRIPKFDVAVWIYLQLKKHFHIKRIYVFASLIDYIKEKSKFIYDLWNDRDYDSLIDISKFLVNINYIGSGTDFTNVYKTVKSRNNTAIIISDMEAGEFGIEDKQKIEKGYFIKIGNAYPTIWEKIFTGIYSIEEVYND